MNTIYSRETGVNQTIYIEIAFPEVGIVLCRTYVGCDTSYALHDLLMISDEPGDYTVSMTITEGI